MAAPNYFKNVIKSIAYTAADIGKDLAPDAVEFAKSNMDFVQETYASIKLPPMQSRRRMQAFQSTRLFKTVDTGFKNIKEDLTTGDFYAKQRADKEYAKLLGFDFDFDDDGFNFDFDSETTDSSSLEVRKSTEKNSMTKGDAKIVQAIEGTSAASAQSTIRAIVATSDNNIQNLRANTAMLYEQNERLFGNMHKDLSVIGATLDSIFKLQTSVISNIDKNISSFQTESLRLDTERNAILKEMLELQKSKNKTAQELEAERASKSYRKNKKFSDFSIGGMIDFDGYFNYVKENIKNEISTYTMGMGMTDLLSTMMVAPTRDAMKMIGKTLIPKVVKTSMESLNESIGGLFGNIINKINSAGNRSNNMIVDALSRIFGIKSDVNRRISTSQYEKGAVAWDGIARKSLITVIPEHLRRIETILSGQQAQTFDYDTGKWTSITQGKSIKQNIRTRAVQSATYDLINDMNKTLNIHAPADAVKRAEYDRAIDEFRNYLYDRDGVFYVRNTNNRLVTASENGITKDNYPMLYKYYSQILKAYKDFDLIDKIDKNGNVVGKRHLYGRKNALASRIKETKEGEERQYRELESSGHSAVTKYYEYDSKIKGLNVDTKLGILGARDKYGQTIHSYLHNINQELMYLRLYGVKGRSGNTNIPGNDVFNQIQSNINENNFKALSDKLYTQRQLEINAQNTNNQNNNLNAYGNDRRSAFEKVLSGRVTDLRDLTNSERKYLLELSKLTSADLKGIYQEQMNMPLDPKTDKVLSQFFNTQFKKARIRTIDDIDRAIDKAISNGGHTYDSLTSGSSNSGSFKDKIVSRYNKGRDYLSNLLHSPGETLSNIIATADKAIYDMFFKLRVDSDGDRYKGFLDFLVGKTSTLFGKLKDALFEKLIDPIRAKLNLEDGFAAKTKTAFKELFNIGRTAIGNTARNIGSDTIDFFTLAKYDGIEGIGNMNTDQFNNLSDSAKRSYRRALNKYSTLEKQVNKAGFRGGVQEKILRLQELGVEQNKIDKILQYGKSEEEINHALNKVYYRLNLRKHARGTLGGYVGNTMLSRGELLFNRSGVSMINKTGAYRVSTPTDILNSEDSYDLLSYLGYKPKFGRKSVITAQREERNKQRELLGHADGTFSLKNIFNRKGSSDDAKALIKEGKKYLPDVVAGAGVGGITSLLLGVVGGPLLGAAVGSGLNLLRKSDAVQNIFLGTKDDEGKRLDNGIISKAVQDTVKKYMPTIGKGSLLGLATSLITPLGPVGGLLIGGALGFLKENEEVREKLFGKLSINTSEKDIISKLLPNTLKGAGLGAVSGLFLGPFGIMGNAAIGAAIGMATSTDEFKDLVFGKMINGERFGGMIGALKDAFSPIKEAGIEFKDRIFSALQDNIIEPLSNFIQPAIHALPQIAGWLPRKLADVISEKFKIGLDQILEHVLVDPIKKLMNPLARFAGNMFRLVTTPFRTVGAAGNLIRKKQIKTGNADYMTAAQRMDWRKKLNMDASAEDAFFASIGSTDEEGNPIFSIDQAKDLRSDLTSMLDTRKSITKDRTSSMNDVNRVLRSYKTVNGKKIPYSTRKEIIKAINEDRTQDIPQILSMGGLDDGEIKTLMDSGKYALRKKIGRYIDLNERQRKVYNLGEADRNKAKSKVEEIFKKQGLDVDLTKNSEIKKFIKYLDTEIDSKEKSESTKGILTDTNKDVGDILGYVKKISKGINIIAGIGDDEINANAKARDKAMSDATGMARQRADAYQEATKNKLGQEIWDQMLPAEQSSFRGGNKKVGSKRRTQAEKKAATTYGIVNEITKKRILYEPEAKEYISKKLGFKTKKYQRLIKFLKNKYIGAIISNGGPISLADLQQYINIAFYDSSFNTAKENAEYVVTRKLMSRYPTISSVMNIEGIDKYQHSVDYNNGIDITQINEPAEDQHGIGTLLAGSVLKSLFGKKKKDSERGGISPLSKIGGSLSAIFSPNSSSASTSISNTDEVDVPGDGRDVGAIGDGLGYYKRKSDNSIEPDMSDSHTKALVIARDKKAELTEKLQKAQLRASDAISKALEAGSMVKEKSKKGLGWLAALLLGGALIKSGIAKKIFDGAVKPLWTDYIKPWVTDTALPFIRDDVIKPIGTFILKSIPTVVETLITKVVPMIGTLIGTGISTLITNLPRLIWNGIHGFFEGLDNLTRNPKNVGGTTDVNINGKTGLSGMLDENGNQLSYEDIASGNYESIYNPQGAIGKVNKDGTITFKDTSMTGSSYASVVGNAAAHGFANRSIGLKAANLIGKPFNKLGNLVSNHGGLVSPLGKYVKAMGGAISKPISTASKAGASFVNRVSNRVNRLVGKGTDFGSYTNHFAKLRAGVLGESDKAKRKANKKDGAFKKLLNNVRDKVKNVVSWFLSHNKIQEKLAEVAESSIVNNTKNAAGKIAKIIPNIEKKIIGVFDDIILKAGDKVGTKVLKQVVRKLGPIVTVGFLVVDFLTGCDRAESILGIEDTNPGQELVAGLINALGNFLIIPAIWPGIPALAQKLYTVLPGDDEKYQQQVAEANQAYQDYIESTGSTLTKEEYLAREYSVTGKIGGWFADKVQGIKNGFKSLRNKSKNIPREALKAKAGVVNPIGALIDKFTNKSDKDIDDPDNNSIPGKIYKMVMFVPNKIKDIKDSIKKKFKEIVGNFGEKTEEEKKTDKDIDDGKISVFSADYWLSALPKDGASTGEILGSIGKTLNRVMAAPILIVKEAVNSLIQGVKNIGVWLADKFGVFGSFFTDPLEFIYRSITGQDDVSEYGSKSNYINQSGKFATSGTSASTTTLKAALNKNTGTNTTVRRSIGKNVNTSRTNRSTGSSNKTSIREYFSNAWSGVKSLFGLGNGPMYYDIPGPHYSKQIDPEIANIRFNSVADRSYQTIGDSACGPAAAVNVMESIYGKGNPVADAASFALSHGYKETDGGTKPEFFTDYFARNGVGSDISYNRQQIQNRINAGLPTVLMGSDSRGTSNSHPFGKNPHYVTVTGIDSRGNAVVQDPESKYSNQVYKVNDLVRKTTLGVSAFGRSRYTRHSSSGRGVFGRGRYGRGKSKMILFGDSRTVGMIVAAYGKKYKTEFLDETDSDGNIWICKVGAGYSYAKQKESLITSKASSEYAIVILMGVNDINTSSYEAPAAKYANWVNGLASNWISKGAEVYYAAIPPIDGVYSTKWGKITNDCIDGFNAKLASSLDTSKVRYIDINTPLKGKVKCGTDHLHYTTPTSKLVFSTIKQMVTSGAISTTPSTASTSTGTTSTAVATASPGVDTRNMLLFEAHYMKDDGKLPDYTGKHVVTSNMNPDGTIGDLTLSESTAETGTGSFRFGAGKYGRAIYPTEAFGRGLYKNIYGNSKYGMGDIENQDLCVWADVTVEEIDNYLSKKAKGTPFEGKGSVFLSIAQSTGFDPAYLIAHSAIESAWGKSNFARNRGNYFGIGAFDSNPSNAYTMSSSAGDFHPDGLLAGAQWIKKNYYDRGQTTLYLFNHGKRGHAYRTSSFAPEVGLMRAFYNSISGYDSRPKSKHNGDGSSVVVDSGSTSSTGTTSGATAVATATAGDSRNMLLFEAKYLKDTEGLNDYTGYRVIQSNLPTDDLTGVTLPKIAKTVASTPITVANTESIIDTDTRTVTTADGQVIETSGITEADLADFEAEVKASVPAKSTSNNASKKTKSTSTGNYGYDFVTGRLSEIPKNNKDKKYPDVLFGHGKRRRGIFGRFKNVNQNLMSLTNRFLGESAEGALRRMVKPSKYGRAKSSIGEFLSNVVANSAAAQVFNSFLDFGVSSYDEAEDVGTVQALASGTTTNNGVTGSGDALNMVRIAQQEEALTDGSNKENPKGSNSVKYNDWYYGKHVSGSAYPWCAAFVAWVANQAGVPTDILPKSASTRETYANVKKHGGSYPQKSEAQPGDLAFYTNSSGSPSGISHIGIVEKLEGGQIYTIEGNTTDAVHRRHFNVSDSSKLIARPAYRAAQAQESVTRGNGGKFPTYALNDAQIKGIANILQHEQPGVAGMQAEASLMANLTDIKGDEYATVNNLVAKATGGWFAKGSSRFHNPGNPSATAIDAAKKVLVQGRRTMPRYINEHDYIGDIASISTGNKRNRSDYHPHETVIQQAKSVGGGRWIYYTHPGPNTDPFGYISKADRQKWGEDHFEASGGNGYKPRSMYGRAKYGMGNRAAEVWNWFTSHGYSDAATAGILGNMQQESGVDPEVIQGGGRGPAAGIVQWENYNTKSARWRAMSDYAKSKGKNWTDLESQLEYVDKENADPGAVYWKNGSTYKSYEAFKAATDVDAATLDFEKAFERAGKPAMANRYSAAHKYYQQFNGTGGTAISSSSSSTGDSSSTATTVTAGPSMSSIGQWLSNVLANSAAGQVLNSFLDFGGGGTTVVQDTSAATTDTSSSEEGSVDGSSDFIPAGNSKLATVSLIAPYSRPRTHAVDTITIHTMAGPMGAKRCCQYFAYERKNASSNYCIGGDGTIALCVEEKNRAFTSSSTENDNRAITFEVSSTTTTEPFKCTDAAYEAIIKLCVDICQRYGKTKMIWIPSKSETMSHKYASNEMRMTLHKWFKNKACPGQYLESHMGDIANQVNARLAAAGTKATSNVTMESVQNQVNGQVAGGFISGSGGNGFKPRSLYGMFTGIDSLTEKDMRVIDSFHSGNIDNSTYGTGNMMPKTEADRSTISAYRRYKDRMYDYGTGKGRSSVNKYRTINIKNKLPRPKIAAGEPEANGFDPVHDSKEIRALNIAYQKLHYGRGKSDPNITYTPHPVSDQTKEFNLLKEIINILVKVAMNTDKLNTIVKILNTKLNINITAEDVSNAQQGDLTSERLAAALASSNNQLNKLNTYADTVNDASIYNIINAMNAIASE